MMATGYVLEFVLPPGTNKSSSLWELTRHQWGSIHAWLGLLMIVVILCHLTLHWQWIVSVIAKLLSKARPGQLKTGLIAVGMLSAGMVVFGYVAQNSVKPISEPLSDTCPPDDLAGRQQSPTSVRERQSATALWNNVYHIFENKCASCHGPTRQAGGFRIDHREQYFKEPNPLVVPGQSAASPLVEILSSKRKDMKLPDKHRINENELDALKAWIDAGARWPMDPN